MTDRPKPPEGCNLEWLVFYSHRCGNLTDEQHDICEAELAELREKAKKLDKLRDILERQGIAYATLY